MILTTSWDGAFFEMPSSREPFFEELRPKVRVVSGQLFLESSVGFGGDCGQKKNIMKSAIFDFDVSTIVFNL